MLRLKHCPGYYAWWTGSTRTLKWWLIQAVTGWSVLNSRVTLLHEWSTASYQRSLGKEAGKFSMKRNRNTVTTNDVNGTQPSKGVTASDRIRSKVDSVVIRRNPYNSQTKRFASKKLFRVDTWNVRTLLETGAAAILVSKLEKGKINMMALQEVRWPDLGETKCGSYTILWSGPANGAPRSTCVAFALDQ